MMSDMNLSKVENGMVVEKWKKFRVRNFWTGFWIKTGIGKSKVLFFKKAKMKKAKKKKVDRKPVKTETPKKKR